MRLSAQGAKKIGIFFGILIYVGVAIFCDILFYVYVHAVFPTGFMSILALVGVFTTGLSVCSLLYSKQYWFAPGLQMQIALVFWGIECCILVLNAILGFQVGHGTLDPVLANWSFVAPASPVIALLFWGILFLTDPSHKMRQAQEELKTVQLTLYTEELLKQARSVDIQDALLHGARLSAEETAEAITGMRLFHRKEQPSIFIDSSEDTSIKIDNTKKNGVGKIHGNATPPM